jgi:hypothetical protein
MWRARRRDRGAARGDRAGPPGVRASPARGTGSEPVQLLQAIIVDPAWHVIERASGRWGSGGCSQPPAILV